MALLISLPDICLTSCFHQTAQYCTCVWYAALILFTYFRFDLLSSENKRVQCSALLTYFIQLLSEMLINTPVMIPIIYSIIYLIIADHATAWPVKYTVFHCAPLFRSMVRSRTSFTVSTVKPSQIKSILIWCDRSTSKTRKNNQHMVTGRVAIWQGGDCVECGSVSTRICSELWRYLSSFAASSSIQHHQPTSPSRFIFIFTADSTAAEPRVVSVCTTGPRSVATS